MCRTWLQAKVHQVFQTRLISLSLSLCFSVFQSKIWKFGSASLSSASASASKKISIRSTTTMDGGDEAQAREKGKTEEYVERALNKNPNVKFILQVWTRLLFFFSFIFPSSFFFFFLLLS